MQGPFSFIGGGGNNLVGAVASGSVITGGGGNICTAPFSTITGGSEAHAFNYGQWAYSSGRFTGFLYGRAQTSLMVVRQRSYTSAPVELLLDGGEVGTHRITVPNGGRWGFEAMVIGTRPNGQTACFETKGAIKNVGNNTAFVGTPAVNKVAADTGAETWNIVVEADSANNALVFKVTGDDSGAVAWVGTVRTVEMNFDPGQ